MKRIIVVLFLIISTFLLQSTVLKVIAFAGIVPNVSLMLTSFSGFMKGKREGMYVGFLIGILMDIFFGGGILGVYALIYMLIGYLNGMFHRIFYPEDFKLPFLFMTGSEIIYCLLSYGLFFLLRSKFSFLSYLKLIMLPELIYTVIVAIIMYKPMLYIYTLLEEDVRKRELNFAK